MALRKATGNMYDFVTHIWNPVKGNCGYDCSYCYVKRIAKRFGKKQHDLSINMEDLNANLGSGNHIFVCSTCDLFFTSNCFKRHCSGILNMTIEKMFETTKLYPGNKYLWHTKNPARALEFQDLFEERDMLCVTIESDRHYAEISQAPSPFERLEALWEWRKPWMLTMEPVMDFGAGGLGMMMLEFVKDNMPVQVNIGADSGRNNLPEPSPEKLRTLIDWLESKGIPVHLKKNLGRLLNG